MRLAVLSLMDSQEELEVAVARKKDASADTKDTKEVCEFALMRASYLDHTA